MPAERGVQTLHPPYAITAGAIPVATGSVDDY